MPSLKFGMFPKSKETKLYLFKLNATVRMNAFIDFEILLFRGFRWAFHDPFKTITLYINKYLYFSLKAFN